MAPRGQVSEVLAHKDQLLGISTKAAPGKCANPGQ